MYDFTKASGVISAYLISGKLFSSKEEYNEY